MHRPNVRLAVTFLAGALAGALLLGGGSVPVSGASPRYQDLSLFSSVLDLVRKNYVEPVDEEGGRINAAAPVKAAVCRKCRRFMV